MRFALPACLLAAACGSGSPRPQSVRASAVADGIDVSWESAAGALQYRAQLADLDTREPLSAPVMVRKNRAHLPGAFSRSLGVWVDAIPGERAVAAVTAGASGGDAEAWQMFGPQDYRHGALGVRFAALGANERLGVLLVNAGGRDGAMADVQIAGVAPDLALPPLMASPAWQPDRVAAVHEQVRAAQSALAYERPAAVEAAPDRRSFCVVQGLDFGHRVRKAVVLALQTEHADLFVDRDDLAHYPADFFSAIGAAFEGRVWPADVTTFGAPTDVDANGKILVLFSHELGERVNGGWLIGYFGNADLLRARDDSPDCGGSGSNHGEIVYLNDIDNGAANGYSAAELENEVYPATLAHELQHLLNFGHRCIERSCAGAQDTWINEALSKLAEDLAGYGWNDSMGRSQGAQYLSRAEGAVRGYDGRSLTRWEGDPIGNYQGAHSFLRFFADRMGLQIASGLEAADNGVEGMEAALGRPLPRAMAEWATALLLSNELDAPYNFSGAAWSPFHERLRHLDTRLAGPFVLRADGIAAVMSAPGNGGPAQVTVRSSEGMPPHVVVVRTSSALPAR